MCDCQELQNKCVNTIRCLAADMVCKANSGHPGAPLGCAPMAHTIWTKHMKFDPQDPKWINRDRFVLSNGHASALLYSMLHLCGFDLPMDELKQFRQLGSRTPGHPEVGHTPGVEVTTGPLGQGLTNAVGMAIAQTNMAGTFNKPGYNIIDGNIFVICGDGCLEEGITSEACSLAGAFGLGNIVLLYDDNSITIDGCTKCTFNEDVLRRFDAYGWHVQRVENGDYDLAALDAAITAAKEEKKRPSIIAVKTTIGYGSLIQGTNTVHGAPLSAADLAQLKTKFGMDPEAHFFVADDVREFYNGIIAKNKKVHEEYNAMLDRYKEAYPEEYKEFMSRTSLKPRYSSVEATVDALREAISSSNTHAPTATRKISGIVLNALAKLYPELIGGSADLTSSNITALNGIPDFTVSEHPEGRYIRFGVREHAMCGISNGIYAFGGFVPFDATFLTFIGYAFGSVRVGALSKFRVLHVFTHDSIGVGEDGPTHIPIETCAQVRAMPGARLYRPCDLEETMACYSLAMNRDEQAVFAFSRQDSPVSVEHSCAKGALHGAYIVRHEEGDMHLCIIATGTEVGLAIQTANKLEADGALPKGSVRVVSAPCVDLFIEQPLEYISSVIPVRGECPVVSVEPFVSMGWTGFLSHRHVGMEDFAASAPAGALYKHFGFTPEHVAEICVETVEKLDKCCGGHAPCLGVSWGLK